MECVLVPWAPPSHAPHPPARPPARLRARAQGLPGFAADATEPKFVTTGFARNAVLAAAGQVVDAVKSGALRHIFLVGGERARGWGEIGGAACSRARVTMPPHCPSPPPCRLRRRRARPPLLYTGGGRHPRGHHAAHAGLVSERVHECVRAWGGAGRRAPPTAHPPTPCAHRTHSPTPPPTTPHHHPCSAKFRFYDHDYGLLPGTQLPRLMDMGQCNGARARAGEGWGGGARARARAHPTAPAHRTPLHPLHFPTSPHPPTHRRLLCRGGCLCPGRRV